jgi:hypothetical protein
MRANSFHCIHHSLDIRPIALALGAEHDLWNEITARQETPGSPHVDTRSIFLRWAADQSLAAVFNDVDAIDYPALNKLPEVRAMIATIAALVEAEKVGRAMIVSLKPGGVIRPHADEGLYADTYERFHLVLESEPGNTFYLKNGDSLPDCAHMEPGELWWFNHKRQHWVENKSNADRIHLIVDMVAPLYRVERGQ